MSDLDNAAGWLHHELAQIVEHELHAEIDAFDIQGAKLTAQALRDEPMPALADHASANNRMGGSIIVVFKFIALIWGTCKMLRDVMTLVRNAKSTASLDADFRNAWEQRLVEAGIDRDLAKKIVIKHGSAIFERLANRPPAK